MNDLLLSERLLRWVFARFPPTDAIFKQPAVRPMAEYTSEVDSGFNEWFGETTVDMFYGKDVLDLGCGFGGRPVRFAEVGARSVLGVEVTATQVEVATQFSKERSAANVHFCLGFGESIPAPEASFDLITMFDVMEHVVDPQATLRECKRVLRVGGRLALVFPPYYSITSGSHLHGYATTFPGLNILFSTRTLRRAVAGHLDEQGIDWRPFMREVPTDKLWNQNGLTVARFKSLVSAVGFRPHLVRYLADLDHRGPGMRGAGRLGLLRTPPLSNVLSLPARVPILQEAACYRVVALLIRE